MRLTDERQIYRVELLDEIPWIEHGFGTRHTGDWPDSAGRVTMRQMHSDRVAMGNQAGCVGEADALISNRPGLALCVRTADCVPLLMADIRNRAVAAVHAGWRGTVSEIAPKTIQAMATHFGTRPEDLRIAIGPAIGECCFEVGAEVAVRFQPFFPERSDLDRRARLDLVETNCRQLYRIGVLPRQIAPVSLCTSCHRDTFHSYRRDRDAAGRMISAIAIRG